MSKGDRWVWASLAVRASAVLVLAAGLMAMHVLSVAPAQAHDHPAPVPGVTEGHSPSVEAPPPSPVAAADGHRRAGPSTDPVAPGAVAADAYSGDRTEPVSSRDQECHRTSGPHCPPGGHSLSSTCQAILTGLGVILLLAALLGMLLARGRSWPTRSSPLAVDLFQRLAWLRTVHPPTPDLFRLCVSRT